VFGVEGSAVSSFLDSVLGLSFNFIFYGGGLMHNLF
jgi:hypothetical protein